MTDDREYLITLIYELFAQGTWMEDTGKYNHLFMRVYEDAQAFLLKENRIKPEECEIV